MNPAISQAKADAALKAIFASIGVGLGNVALSVRKPTAGKVYELVVLADVLTELQNRGFFLSFSNPAGKIALKGAPGQLSHADPHFDVATTAAGVPEFQVFVSVEFRTMGSAHATTKDLSEMHEIDIGVFETGAPAYPAYDQVALAVECKAWAKLTKATVRGVLGLRRELSLLSRGAPSKLAAALGHHLPRVPADPASEVWMVATDPQIQQFQQSPMHFGIVCKHVPT